jgi:hypothetical protein
MDHDKTQLPEGSLGKQALQFYRERERLCGERNDFDAVQCALYGQAQVHRDRGEAAEAQRLLERQQNLCQQLVRRGDLYRSLTTQARLAACGPTPFYYRDRVAGAVNDECKEIESLATMAGSWMNDGLLNAALTLLEEVTDRCRQIHQLGLLAKCLGQQAEIRAQQGDVAAVQMFDEADGCYRALERQYEALGRDGHEVRRPLAAVLANHAALKERLGALQGAILLLEREEVLLQGIQDQKVMLLDCYHRQARIYQLMEDDWHALELLRRQEALAKELNKQLLLRRILEQELPLLEKLDDLDGALPVLTELKQLARQPKDAEGLTRYLSAEVRLLTQMRHWPEALASALECQQVAGEAGDNEQSLKAEHLVCKLRDVIEPEATLDRHQERPQPASKVVDTGDESSPPMYNRDDLTDDAEGGPPLSFREHLRDLIGLISVIPPVWFVLTVVTIYLLPETSLLERTVGAAVWAALPAYVLWSVQLCRFCVIALSIRETLLLVAGLVLFPVLLLGLGGAAMLPDYAWHAAFGQSLPSGWILGLGKILVVLCSFVLFALMAAQLSFAVRKWATVAHDSEPGAQQWSFSHELGVALEMTSQASILCAVILLAAPAAMTATFLLPLQILLVVLSSAWLIASVRT